MQPTEAIQGRNIADLYDASRETVRGLHLVGLGESLNQMQLALNKQSASMERVGRFIVDIAGGAKNFMLLAISGPDNSRIRVLAITTEQLTEGLFMKDKTLPTGEFNVGRDTQTYNITRYIRRVLRQEPHEPFYPYVAALVPAAMTRRAPFIQIGGVNQEVLAHHLELLDDIELIQKQLGYDGQSIAKALKHGTPKKRGNRRLRLMGEDSVRLADFYNERPELNPRLNKK